MRILTQSILTTALLCISLHWATPPVLATQDETQTVHSEVADDGPYVLWRDAETAVILSYCDGEVVQTVVENITKPIQFSPPCSPLTTIHLDPSPPQPIPATWEMPTRLLAVSDLEGNYDTFVQFLKANKVVDDEGHWAWGDGHLAFVGDIVDRGDQVTELLWYIRALEHEANAAGGHVHYILGNHEAMIMAGDLRYIHPKYTATSEQLGHTYDALFGSETELGRWFRTRNSIEQIGPLLFVHAGYSPVLEQLKLEPEQINEQIQASLGPPIPKRADRKELATSLEWNRQGPMWYRGYFARYAKDYGDAPSDEQLLEILKRHQAEYIVVGHSVVDDITWIDENNRLIGIDVKWNKPTEGEGLLVENGTLSRVNMTGKRIPLESKQKDSETD